MEGKLEWFSHVLEKLGPRVCELSTNDAVRPKKVAHRMRTEKCQLLEICVQKDALGNNKTCRPLHPEAVKWGICAKLDRGGPTSDLPPELLKCPTSVKKPSGHQCLGTCLAILKMLFVL